jgi:hypothetical protein
MIKNSLQFKKIKSLLIILSTIKRIHHATHSHIIIYKNYNISKLLVLYKFIIIFIVYFGRNDNINYYNKCKLKIKYLLNEK